MDICMGFPSSLLEYEDPYGYAFLWCKWHACYLNLSKSLGPMGRWGTTQNLHYIDALGR